MMIVHDYLHIIIYVLQATRPRKLLKLALFNTHITLSCLLHMHVYIYEYKCEVPTEICAGGGQNTMVEYIKSNLSSVNRIYYLHIYDVSPFMYI